MNVLPNNAVWDAADGAGCEERERWDPPVPLADVTVPDFPIEALSDPLRAFVQAEAQATQTPPDLAGMLTLATCAAAVAKKVALCVQDGWIEPLNIWTVITQPPGTRKSAVFTDVTRPLRSHEAAELERLRSAVEEAQSRRRIAEAALRKAEEAAARAAHKDREAAIREAERLAREVVQMVVPALPRYIADDVTPERLASLLHEQGGRIAVMSPEGDVFDQMAGRYSSNGGPNLGVYLKGHAGDDLRVDRVGRAAEYVRALALTLGLAVQPDVLRGLIDKPGFRGRGLLGRFLYACPPDLLGRRQIDPPAVPNSVRRAYEIHVEALLRLPAGTDTSGRPIPHLLQLSTPALDQLHEFQRKVELELSEFGGLGTMRDWGGKLVGAVARIAGVLHLSEHVANSADSANSAHGVAPWEVPISRETLCRAIRFGKYLIPHARAAYAMMGTDPKIERARLISNWIVRMGCELFSVRDAFNGLKGRFQRVSELESALPLLVEHAHIRLQPTTKPSSRGRPPSPIYEVNPAILIPQYSHNPQKSDGLGN
jgi:hypothetical protein